MMARRASEEQLRLEVRELTDLLREDRSFADLRDVLLAKGLSPSDVILVGLIEGEDESRYGVIATGEECIRFETAPNGALTLWEFVEDLDALANDFEAASVGVAMKRSGDIS